MAHSEHLPFLSFLQVKYCAAVISVFQRCTRKKLDQNEEFEHQGTCALTNNKSDSRVKGEREKEREILQRTQFQK